ncbi:MAG: hypothetical protein DSZ33_00405 [Gammaproteobacteria bacterium]|nr:MAG: hypothetical protein DSZ33_00405 [Gammaproteobacteria bacterium]
MKNPSRGKRWLLLWIALIFVAVLALLIYWFNMPAPVTTQAAGTSQASSISIETAGQTPIRFSFANNRWLMTSPMTARPNQARLQLLLNLRNQIPDDATTFQASDVNEGMIPTPDITINIDGETYAFGALTADRQYRHVRYHDTDYLLHDPWFSDTTVEMDEFLDRRLLARGSVIDEIRLPDVSLHKQASGAWKPDKPLEVSTGALAALVMNWQLAYASALHAGPENIDGKPDVSIHLSGDARDRWHHFSILQRAPMLKLYDPEARISYSFPVDIASGLLDLQALNAETEIVPEPRLQ